MWMLPNHTIVWLIRLPFAPVLRQREAIWIIVHTRTLWIVRVVSGWLRQIRCVKPGGPSQARTHDQPLTSGFPSLHICTNPITRSFNFAISWVWRTISLLHPLAFPWLLWGWAVFSHCTNTVHSLNAQPCPLCWRWGSEQWKQGSVLLELTFYWGTDFILPSLSVIIRFQAVVSI